MWTARASVAGPAGSLWSVSCWHSVGLAVLREGVEIVGRTVSPCPGRFAFSSLRSLWPLEFLLVIQHTVIECLLGAAPKGPARMEQGPQSRGGDNKFIKVKVIRAVTDRQ